MVQDNPNMQELEELIGFCRSVDNLYLFGHDMPQRLISKYLYQAGIKLTGFIKPEVHPSDKENEPFPVINLSQLNAKSRGYKRKSGVIFSGEQCFHNQDIELMRMLGISKVFLMSDWNRRTIPYKMTPRSKEMFWVEVNLADHCNLNCQCCDHFSPLATPTFLDIIQYEKDLKRLAELTDGEIGLWKLQGGEPLLNKQLIDYIKLTRKYFPDSFICLFTDGLLLNKWGKEPEENNIWNAVKEYEIEIRITEYPINLNIEVIKEQVSKHGIPFYTDPPEFKKSARVWCFSEIGALDYKGIKHSVKHPFDLNGEVEKFRFISCYQFNESIVLRDGRIYTCPMIPYVHYFNEYFKQNLEVTEADYIDIYAVNSYEEIAEFCTHRVPFCRYCAVHKRSVRDWKQSEHDIEEWIL